MRREVPSAVVGSWGGRVCGARGGDVFEGGIGWSEVCSAASAIGLSAIGGIGVWAGVIAGAMIKPSGESNRGMAHAATALSVVASIE